MNNDPFIPARSSTARAAPPQRDSGPDERDGGQLDIVAIYRALWRGKWLVLATVALSIAAAIVWLVAIAVPKYTASATVALKDRQEQVVDIGNVIPGMGGDRFTVNTQVEVLRARSLLGEVVDVLDLTADPEFNKYIRAPSTGPAAQIKRAVQGLFTAGADGARALPPARRQRDETIEELRRRLSIQNVPVSYVFELVVTTEEAEKSALIANTLAGLYVQKTLDAKNAANRRARTKLEVEVEDLELKLRAAEDAVNEYAAAADLISEEALAQRRAQLKEFRTRKADTEAAAARLTAQAERMAAAARRGDAVAMAEAADDEALRQQAARLDAGGAADDAFEARFAALTEQIAVRRTRAIEQAAALEASIGELEKQVAAQSAELLKLKQLEREAAADKLIYEYSLGRLREISVQEGLEQQSDSEVLSEAVVPTDPSAPRTGTALAIAVLAGIALGGGLVTVREMLNTTLRSGEDLERATGHLVLGEIQRAPTTRRRRLLHYIVAQSTSAFSESVRDLRTSILMSSIDRPPQVIMLTSSIPNEGKTTQSLALTHSLASMGKKVLLIEGDIRRRTLKEYFESAKDVGLAAAVAEDADLSKIVLRSEELGADVLMGETSKSNAADFFTSEQFRGFLERVRRDYDFVVIDTPPVLVVPDARVIGPLCDFVLYVVHWDRTTQRQVRQGLKAFATVNVPVNGLALSQVDRRRQKSYGYGDGYGSYGKRYYTAG